MGTLWTITWAAAQFGPGVGLASGFLADASASDPLAWLVNVGAVGVFLVLFLTGQIFSKSTVKDLRDVLAAERLEHAADKKDWVVERGVLQGRIDDARAEVQRVGDYMRSDGIPTMTRMVDASGRLLEYLVKHQ